jgi:hypothetical protein
VGKHLKHRETAEYAIRVLASLLMLGNVVGDDSFALAVYEGENVMANSESTNSVPSLSSEGTLDTPPEKAKPCEIVFWAYWNGTGMMIGR